LMAIMYEIKVSAHIIVRSMISALINSSFPHESMMARQRAEPAEF
jgi:hypothetical protein